MASAKGGRFTLNYHNASNQRKTRPNDTAIRVLRLLSQYCHLVPNVSSGNI